MERITRRDLGALAADVLARAPQTTLAQIPAQSSPEPPLDVASWSYHWYGVEHATLARGTAVVMGERIMAAGGLDIGGIEYLEAGDGTRIFYDVNANSNLRAPIGQAFGFDPFERVVDYLTDQIERGACKVDNVA